MSNDFHYFVGEKLTNSQKIEALENHFIPYKHYKFPVCNEYGNKRSFNSSWLDLYKWLVYSPKDNGAYCKYCVLFGNTLKEKSGLKADKLVTSPLTFWTTASEKLKGHNTKSAMHQTTAVMAEEFLKIMKSEQMSIDQHLNSVMAKQIEHNKQKLFPIIKTILFCGQQNIALRGHRESDSSRGNPGNFKALLKFRVDSGDHVLKEHLESSPRNAMYTSNIIQNSLINIIGNWLQNKIVTKISAGSKVFSVLADEARDCFNKEQMAIIIRYVDENSTIQESFLCFVECEHGTSGGKLALLIEKTCLDVGLDMSMCRGQGYDGAGNMAGACTGVAKQLRTKYPKAIYFHCASHRLNLCIAHACKLTSVSSMMTSISSMANFFNYSPKRQKFLEDHVAKYPQLSKSKLLPLCRTRWVERINALEVSLDLLEAIVNTFTDMAMNTQDWNRETVSQAISLLRGVDFDYIINLVITQKVISYTSSLTVGLQKRDIDLASMSNHVQLVIRTLQLLRSNVDMFHKECFKQAADVAQKVNVAISKPRVCGRQVHRQNVSVLTSSQMSVEQQVSDHYRINLTIPILDDVIGCLLERFSDGQEPVFKGIVLLPSNVITVPNWEDRIQSFVQVYSDDVPSFSSLVAELHMWKQMWMDKWSCKWQLMQEQHKKTTGQDYTLTPTEMNKLKACSVPNKISSTLLEINQVTFPNIYCLLTILAVLPVTTCEAERSISCLRRLKTYMRSTMVQDRFSGLALMSVYRDIAVDIPEIVQKFALEHPR